MLKSISCFFILFSFSELSYSQELVINEFLASNTSINRDPDFNSYSDWIEIFNPGPDSINMSNYYLTDNFDVPNKWQIAEGTVIASGAFLVIWADGQNQVLNDYHTNFRLAKSGEEIGFYDTNLEPIDTVRYTEQISDISYGRQPDGAADWYNFEQPTPDRTNNTSILLITPAPQFSLSEGFYTNSQTLELLVADPEATIQYTINGNEPSDFSPVYENPIIIKSRIGEANRFSNIRTNKDPYLWLPDWTPPMGEIFKATYVRARAVKNGYRPSKTITKTYFIDQNIYQRYPTIPVISIVSDYKNLFDNNTGKFTCQSIPKTNFTLLFAFA